MLTTSYLYKNEWSETGILRSRAGHLYVDVLSTLLGFKPAHLLDYIPNDASRLQLFLQKALPHLHKSREVELSNLAVHSGSGRRCSFCEQQVSPVMPRPSSHDRRLKKIEKTTVY